MMSQKEVENMIETLLKMEEEINLVDLLETYPEVHFILPNDIRIRDLNYIWMKDLSIVFNVEQVAINLTGSHFYIKSYDEKGKAYYSPLRKEDAEYEMNRLKELGVISFKDLMDQTNVLIDYPESFNLIGDNVKKLILINLNDIFYTIKEESGYFLSLRQCAYWLKGSMTKLV